MNSSSGGKAAVRLAIQKEVFTPHEERLLGLAAVSKPGRKRKISHLCVSVNVQEKPPKVSISRIKLDDQRKDKQIYKQVKKWDLSDLRIIDGKSADAEVPEFDLHFEKGTFKWVASSVADKKAFIVCLYKMIHKYLPRSKPEFVHVNEDRLQELLTTAETGGRGREIEEETVQQEDYQELTEKEQLDLEKLLKDEEEKLSGETALHDIEAFTERLSQQLSQLDEANIHTLMDSEAQICSLMNMLDNTMLEIQQTETKLAVYDELLSSVRSNMSKLAKDYYKIVLWDKNLKSLHDQVEDIVEKLYLDPKIEKTLKTCQLTGDSNIRTCTEAIKSLQRVMSQQLSPGVHIMQAVTDQNKYFTELSRNFGQRLQQHLCMLFAQRATKLNENVAQRQHNIGLPTLTAHGELHNELRLYTDLMGWLKQYESQRFEEVCEAYCVEFKKVYDNEIKAFVADVKAQLVRATEPSARKAAGLISASGSFSKFNSGSQADLSFRGSTQSFNSPHLRGISTSLMDFNASMKMGGGAAEPDKPKFDQIFMLVLDQLYKPCNSEQKFCLTFFHIPKDSDSDEELPSSNRPDEDGMEETDSFLSNFARKRELPHLNTVDLMDKGVKGLLQQLFNCLVNELESLIMFGEKMDSLNCLQLLVAISQRVMLSQEGGQFSYLDHCLTSSMVTLKTQFVKLVGSKEKAIKESKVPRKSGKCGVIPAVKDFGQFAEKCERIVMGSDKRMDLDNAYKKLISALFDTIDKLSEEHPKTPRSVVLLENYYEVYDILSHLKIQCLEEAREDAKKISRVQQEAYVITCLGKPLDKLSTFFDGVEKLLKSGINAEQIGFYRDYNKSELIKCIQSYPGKEVKKGLEKLYKRCDKDLSEESGRLRVVWGAMQQAIIKMYEHFTMLIDKCYPKSNLQLEFTLSDIIEYFRSISED